MSDLLSKECARCKRPFSKPVSCSLKTWDFQRKFCSWKCNQLTQGEFKISNPALRQRNYRLKRLFKIDLQEYNRLFQIQGGMCRLCGVHQSKLKVSLAVDHNHATGKIRGLLCMTCNRALGLFKDNLELLEKAKQYILVSSEI